MVKGIYKSGDDFDELQDTVSILNEGNFLLTRESEPNG